MRAFLNGAFVPEAEASVPVSDRGFLYGDGLFETLRVARGRPCLWERHWARLSAGAAFLKLSLPHPSDVLLHHARRLAELNALPEAVLRLTLTRGSGPRGYSPRGADMPTLVMTLAPLPENPPGPARLITSSYRVVAGDPLAAFKTCSKLTHVLARAEADTRNADDALLLNTDGYCAEATASNVFWVDAGVVCTPPLHAGALAGITRAWVMEWCESQRIPIRELAARPEALPLAEGLFLTRSVAGIVPVAALDNQPMPALSLVAQLQTAWDEFRSR